MESLKNEVEKQENELTMQKSTLGSQQSGTQQLFQGVEKLRLGQKKRESRIQSASSESDQKIVRLKSKISVCIGLRER